MPVEEMVKPADYSSDTERADDHPARKHGRTSSSDRPSSTGNIYNIAQSIERSSTPASPARSKNSDRTQSKRRKSSISGKTKSRPTYSRRYSTPPSRPLSPAGFPKHMDLDSAIPEIDLNEASRKIVSYQPVDYQPMGLLVDTAPQNPDIFFSEVDETDYFSTVEGTRPKPNANKSRRQVSQNMGSLGSLNALMAGNVGVPKNLQQIKEDGETEFWLPPTPGAFAT